VRHFDLIIIGTGSGNSIITPEFDNWDVAIVERDVFGGTCLNRGCVPSKMFVHAADVAYSARTSSHLGVDLLVDKVRWSDIVDRVFGWIDPIAQGGETYRENLENVTVYKTDARLVGPKTVDVGGEEISADHIVIAAGARSFVPDIPGLETISWHTSDTIMRIDQFPERMVVMGAGYIAAEMAHVFDGLGSKVTVINRSSYMLRGEDSDVRHAYTELAKHRFDVALNAEICGVRPSANGTIEVEYTESDDTVTVEADALLIATGRIPNALELGAADVGIETDDSGYIVTDSNMATNIDGVWALGDITNPLQLKHSANAEARVISRNLLHPDELTSVDLGLTPHAVFTNPQVASIGITEQALEESGRPYKCSIRPYGDTAYGWALDDTSSFCKILMDPDTRLILGAHIMGPQASTLIQQLIQGMRFGQTVDEMAVQQYYIHPALPEVVEQALLEL
jgi:mycothione reductase